MDLEISTNKMSIPLFSRFRFVGMCSFINMVRLLHDEGLPRGLPDNDRTRQPPFYAVYKIVSIFKSGCHLANEAPEIRQICGTQALSLSKTRGYMTIYPEISDILPATSLSGVTSVRQCHGKRRMIQRFLNCD